MAVDNNIRYQSKSNYIHRRVGGKDILIPVAENVADFNGFIELNPTAAYIWDMMQTPQTVKDVSVSLASEFGTDEATAAEDTEEFMSLLLEHKMLIEVR